MNKELRIKNQGLVIGIRTDSMDATLVLLSSPHGLTGGPSPESPLSSPIGSKALRVGDPLTELARLTYPAGRQLSMTLLSKIEELLTRNNLTWTNLSGIVVFAGPGSFTSLRIGITIANTMAYSLSIPIVGSVGDDWIQAGVNQLATARPGQWVVPEYGAEANITKPRK